MMMNTANVTASSISSATTATIMKTTSQPQQPLSLPPSGGIIPAAILTTNERINNANCANNTITSHQNHEPANTAVVTQSVTAFIHAPSQPLHSIPNNLVTASGQPQIQTVATNASIIHPATIGHSGTTIAPSVVCTATLLSTGTGQQVNAIPVGVTGSTVSVLKPTIGQRFQTANVMTSGGPQAGPINALFIHHDVSKAPTVAHSASNAPPHHIQPNSVINATVSMPGPTVTVHQPAAAPAHAPTPLFIQTGTPTPNNAILHTTNISHNSTTQPANLSTINLPTSSSQQQQQFQRLKVEDALSYLDQVKFKFNDQPQVYNDFLDIMKEFKSQSIDTPGVIQRVSTLFKGHPELIVGFNTFLPPGYKIEIHSNDQVNVSMPNSTNVVLMSTTPVGPHQPAAVATSAIVTGPGVHQLSSNLPRNTIVTVSSASNLHQSNHHTVSFSNSIPARDVSSASAPAVSNTNSSQPRADSGHNNQRNTVAANSSVETSNSRITQPHAAQNTASGPTTGSQPVEFNHAINYVNKIKNRFQQQPEIYKQFLDILQSYQKEQRSIKEGTAVLGQKFLTESEVYTQVAKLFQNQEDLLQEFSQFLPDANNNANPHSHPSANLLSSSHNSNTVINSSSNSSNFNLQSGSPASVNYTHNVPNIDPSPYNSTSNSLSANDHGSLMKKSYSNLNNSSSVNRLSASNNNNQNAFSNSLHRFPKRSSGSISNDQNSSYIPNKRSKLIVPSRDPSITDGGNHTGDIVEYAFFDRLRNAMNFSTYEDFNRTLVLYNFEIISRSELLALVTPALSQFPELLKRFKDIIGIKEGGLSNSFNNTSMFSLFNNSYSSLANSSYLTQTNTNSKSALGEGLSNRRDRRDSDYIEVDYNSCKRYGVSYRTIPKTSAKQECSGRTPLCHEVLNDTLVSFPSWSEDSTFVSSRKTQYEEYIYRCEDERYELDLVLETNLATIRVLENVKKKMDRMTSEQRANFKLDDTLGGTSKVIHLKSIRRIYGDKSSSVIDGLKNSPSHVVPIVIRRLLAKGEEWREAQKQFNKIWREQNEKYYLKSLDHQGISFKQNDIKYLRSKSLLNEIENISDERQVQNQCFMQENLSPNSVSNPPPANCQPHMVFVYPDKSMIEVACNLIIHHVKRQTSIQKDDKQKIKHLMRNFIPDFFATPRGELSDDEIDEEIKIPFDFKKEIKAEDLNAEKKSNPALSDKSSSMLNSNPDDEYALFYVNHYWFLFFRLHYILCERLSKMHSQCKKIARDLMKECKEKRHSPSSILKYNNNVNVNVEGYFTALVDMVKQVLDGNLESNQFEDTLREMFGIHAYIAFTLDKVVQNIVRQLQHIVVDEVCHQCTEMYLDAKKEGAAGGLCVTTNQRIENEANYHKNAEQAMSEENFYKVVLYKGEAKITFELIECSEDESSNDGDEESNSTQSSRTLRSSAKTMPDKDDGDMEKLNEEVEKSLQDNPAFLKRILLKQKAPIKAESKSELNDTEMDVDSNEETSDQKPSEEKQPPPSDKTKCEFSLKQCRSLFIVQNENVLCRTRFNQEKVAVVHKRVTKHMYDNFSKFYNKWLDANCPTTVRERYENWFLTNDTTNFNLHPSDENNNRDSAEKDCEESTTTTATSSTADANASSAEAEKPSTESSEGVNLTKSIQKVIFEEDSKPPYRTYCRYLFR